MRPVPSLISFLALLLFAASLSACLPDGDSGSGTTDGTTNGTSGGTSGGTASDGTSGGTSGGTASDGTSGGTSGDVSGEDVGRPTPIPLADGWQRAFSAESAGINCAFTEEQLRAAGAPSLTFGDATIYVGFEQLGQNQDPVFVRFDSGAQSYCEHHEREAPDGRAYGLTWDGGPTAYVVYTIVGGGSAFDAKGKGQWLDRYGDGGGSAKVSFLGEVETAFGTLSRGTFVIAKKKDGKTNTHSPADAPIVSAEGDVVFYGDSAFQPMNPDKSIMDCADYPFYSTYRFSSDLTTLRCSSCTNCTSQQPCTP
jgi:hypothetical protein